MSAISEVRLASVRKLKPNKHNARKHSKNQVRQIANSILRFGWTYAILVDERWAIIAGHGRHLAALSLGLREVPVIMVTGLSETEKRALALADNKIDAIERAGVRAVVSGDASCLMQIEGRLKRKGSSVRAMHLAELLASQE